MKKKNYFINFGIGFLVGMLISIYLFSFRTADLYWHASLPLDVLLKWIGYQFIAFLKVGFITGFLLSSFLAVRRAVLDKEKRWYRQFLFDLPLLFICFLISWLQVNYFNPISKVGIYPVAMAARFNGDYREAVRDTMFMDMTKSLEEYPFRFTTPVVKERIATFQQRISGQTMKADSLLSVLPDSLAEDIYEYNDLQELGLSYHKYVRPMQVSPEKCDTLLQGLGDCVEGIKTLSESLNKYERELAGREMDYYFVGFYIITLLSGAFEGFWARRRKQKNSGGTRNNRFRRLMKDKRFAIPICIIGILVLLFYQRGVQHIVHAEQVPCKFPVVVYGKMEENRITRIRFPFTVECRSLSLRTISYNSNGYWSDWEKKWGRTHGTSSLVFVEDCDTLKMMEKEKGNPELNIRIYPSRQYILQQGYLINKDSLIQQYFSPYLLRMREVGKDTLHLTYQQMEHITPGLIDSILSGDTISIGFRYDGKSNGIDIPVRGF